MNEAIDVAVYLVLALASRLAFGPPFCQPSLVRQPGLDASRTAWLHASQASPAPVAKAVEKARRSIPSVQRRHAPTRVIPQDHALPPIIPTALVPAATYNDNKKAAMTIEGLAERLAAIK